MSTQKVDILFMQNPLYDFNFDKGSLPVHLSHLLTDFLFLVGGEQVWHFTSVQQVVDVLQEWLLLDLTVEETSNLVSECKRWITYSNQTKA